MDLRVGPELHDRLKVVSERFNRSMAKVVEAADRSWTKAGMESCSIMVRDGSATFGGTSLTVKCDRDPAELRVIIDWYITPYESMEVEVPSLSKELLEEARRLECDHRRVEILTAQAEVKVKLMELEAGIVT